MSQLYSGASRNAVIDISSSGANEIIAAPSTGYIVVDMVAVLPTTAVAVTPKAAARALTGPLPLDAKQPFTFSDPKNADEGLWRLNPGEAFNITLGGAVQVVGFVKYRIIN